MTDTTAAAGAPTMPKVDPETLVIRATPPTAIRFKRGLIVGLAAIGVILLVIVAWFALKPHVFHVVATQEDMSEPENRPTSDALNGLPKSYGDVPRLGPPLPGDLGKPILEHEPGLAVDDRAGARSAANQAAAAERERQLAELKAARQSAVLVQSGTRADTSEAPAIATAEPPASAPGNPDKLAIDPDRDPNGQQRKSDFVAKLDKDGDINPHTLAVAASPYMLSAGSVISASLITGLSSDLPGLVTAQVTENVFDSATGSVLLVPQGARLIGSYDSVVAFGQKRALVVWQRIILPNGSSLRIDNVPASDAAGYAGLEDKVDFQTWALLKGIVLSTLVGVGSELQFTGNGGLIEAIRQSGQQNVSRTGDQLVSKTLNIQPTITVRPGTPVRLVVRKDLILPPWRG
ncbi:MAG: TrbI/VirB10 family protein [Sphingomonadaceae bacterium]|nr:TrbI/VirB10 family protein [Sphingomonadaceae bacterium]